MLPKPKIFTTSFHENLNNLGWKEQGSALEKRADLISANFLLTSHNISSVSIGISWRYLNKFIANCSSVRPFRWNFGLSRLVSSPSSLLRDVDGELWYASKLNFLIFFSPSLLLSLLHCTDDDVPSVNSQIPYGLFTFFSGWCVGFISPVPLSDRWRWL